MNDLDEGGVVPTGRVVGDQDPIPIRVHAHVADPAIGLVQHRADRILQPHRTVDFMGGGQILAVGSPVGDVDIFQQPARRRAPLLGYCESPDKLPADAVTAI